MVKTTRMERRIIRNLSERDEKSPHTFRSRPCLLVDLEYDHLLPDGDELKKIIDNLEEKEILETEKLQFGETGKRGAIVRLTEKGLKEMNKLQKKFEEEKSELMKKYGF